MFCKNCGQEVNDNATFCPKCGSPVKAANPGNYQQPTNGGYGNPTPNAYNYTGHQNYAGGRRPAARGKVLLMVTGILTLIGGIVSVVTLLGSLGAMNYISAGLAWLGISTGAFYGYVVFDFVAAAILLITGIVAIANSGKPAKADLVFKLGIATIICRIVDWIWGSALVGGYVQVVTPLNVVLGLIVPVLLLVGASMNKKS